MADRLRQAVRTQDTVARFGGDEFVVVCEDAAAGWEAGTVAERISDAFEAPFLVDGDEVFLSVSVGVAVGTDDDSPEGLIQDADSAMYRAKASGRARLEFFDENMRTEAADLAWTSRAPSTGPSNGTSCGCTTSRSSTCRRARSPASKRSCAGSTRSEG